MLKLHFILIFCFVSVLPLNAQNSEEVYEMQKMVIRNFYQLLFQDSSVTVSQANEVFHPEDLWNIEYYSDSLSDKQKSEFFYGDPDTLISRTFKKIKTLVPGYIFPFEPSALTDSGRTIIGKKLNIELEPDSSSINKDTSVKTFRYLVRLNPTMHWWVTFEFFGHPNQYISKIILKNGTDLLEKIGLTK